MARILITGSTGMVGSSVVPLLKQAGHELIYLIRANNIEEANNRLSGFVKVDSSDRVLCGDITFPYCGILSESERKGLTGQIDKILHCAASIKFDENMADEIKMTNIEGTENMLNLASELQIPEVHDISTLYIAGDAEEFSESNLDIGQNLRNTYEFSKSESEKLVRAWDKGKYSIYRLGIVVGDSQTGYSPFFSGYYSAFTSLWKLYNLLLNRWRQEQEACKRDGIVFDDNNIVNLPIRILCSFDSTLNLIPVDWTARIITSLLDIEANNQVYHVAHPNPPATKWIVENSLDLLNFTNYQLVNEDYEPRNDLLGKLERRISRSVKPYQPYIMHEARFLCDETMAVLGDKFVAPPVFTKELLDKLLSFAKAHNFGFKK